MKPSEPVFNDLVLSVYNDGIQLTRELYEKLGHELYDHFEEQGRAVDHFYFGAADGSSLTVHSGTALFTLLGFMGIDLVIGLAFLWLIARELAHGPDGPEGSPRTEVARG